jgi:hypothetical protein
MADRLRCETCGHFMPMERAYPPLEETRCEGCAERDPRVWDAAASNFILASEVEWRQRRDENLRALRAMNAEACYG